MNTIHARFRELSAAIPRVDGEYDFLSESEDQIEDMAAILQFNKYLTLAAHPLEHLVARACTWTLKMGMTAIGSRPRQIAEAMADRVMTRAVAA